MTDIALTEWEHQPYVLNVLTSREMGAWLERRDSRKLQEIRKEICDMYPNYTDEKGYRMIRKSDVLNIIDKHIKEFKE